MATTVGILKIDDKFKIAGESTYTGYEKQIEVLGFSHKVQLPMVSTTSSSSRVSGSPTMGEVSCVQQLSSAYVKFLEACAKGINLGNVSLTLVKVSNGKPVPVLLIALTNTYVSLVEIGSGAYAQNHKGEHAEGSNLVLPRVNVNLNFETIQATYTQYSTAGQQSGNVASPVLNSIGA